MKSVKKVLRILIWIILSLIIIATVIWLSSPYPGYNKGKINSEVTIFAPCSTAFSYLGSSDNARDWSVFVDFITTINSNEVEDGMVGSKRICYTSSDTSSFNWEEEILEVIPNEYRKLSCYNYRNLFMKAPELITEQIYVVKQDGCRLKFTLDVRKKPNITDQLKMKLAAFRIQKIFNRNLKNIKKEVEDQYLADE